ncbi:hypothetical protein AALO_G00203960 [Alosa alosa]|uniref:Serine/Arginine-related protein 53 n=1 Tax=Alosa alosa TaxID=278164 RepID=A0AAV6G3I6_9TELE|nr:hypothetical protein AALO_G00203960 [Alosa alosa]
MVLHYLWPASKRPRRSREAASIKAALEHLTPSEQAKARLQLVLQAAAKTDEALRAKLKRDEDARKVKEEEGTTLEEQVRRIKDIEAIESDSFVPQAFKSSRETPKASELVEVKKESVSSDWSEHQAPLPTTIVYNDNDGDSLAHPSLFLDKEEAEERWLNRLVALRQERLMGSPVP